MFIFDFYGQERILPMYSEPDASGPFYVGRRQALTNSLRGSVLLLGNFDALHLGHRHLLTQARRKALKSGAPLAIMSCEPHPRQIFNPDAAPFRLSSLASKAINFSGSGVDLLYSPTFDKTFAGLAPSEFIGEALIDQLRVSAVVCGTDFRFGKGRAGSPEDLHKAGERFGFEVLVATDYFDGGEKVSSSRVRNLLAMGDVDTVARLLGGSWLTRARATEDGALRFDTELMLPPPGRYTVRIRSTRATTEMCLDEDRKGWLTAPLAPGFAFVEWLGRANA